MCIMVHQAMHLPLVGSKGIFQASDCAQSSAALRYEAFKISDLASVTQEG